MIGQRIDLVAGDFNGTAWRCSNRNNISTIEEAFADCALPAPPGLYTIVGTRFDSQHAGLTFVGSLNLLNQIGIGKYDFMVLSPSHIKTLGLRPADQSCHETWLHLDFVDWRNSQSRRT